MSIASLKVVPEDIRTSIIRVYSYQNKNMQGLFYNPYYGEELAFGSLTRLFLLMEDLMDAIDCPQASVRSRRFTPKTAKDTEQIIIAEQLQLPPDQPVIATFKLKVLFRQGASWQGKLLWVDAEKEQPFRSALELIKLLDSALPQPEVVEQSPTAIEAENLG